VDGILEPEDSSRARLPSGTVTFAFTDIEGSTRRWDADPSAMQEALRRHDAHMRAAIAVYDGHVFKTIGDAFCAVFSRPEDALSAMLTVQNTLAAEDFSAVGGLRVRAAVHTGTAEERDRDFFGPAVNRVARLVAIGHGGQVLVSGATAQLVRDVLPLAMSLRDLGEHRLKDLTRPEHVYQLVGPGLFGDFPRLRSLETSSHNLPETLTPLIGREADVAGLTSLLGAHRSVTIVGAGGVGKTRTSLQVAANLLKEYDDGVWLVELAPLTEGESIPSTIAQAVGVSLAPGDGSPLDTVVRQLKEKNVLLVVDNCEHLIRPAAKAIAEILRACPAVAVLASSRQALEIRGEQAYRLPSLGFPASDAGLTAVAALQSPAVALFVARAHAADQRFAITDDNAQAIADICRRLDGIPLAIELAAPRVRVMNPRQLRERLDARFRVLTRASHDVLERQQTLRAMIDWSYDLLSERERTYLCRLSVFAGSFTLASASAVAAYEPIDEIEGLQLLGSLVDKSLLSEVGHVPERETRFRLSETVRSYTLEKFEAREEREVTLRRYASAMLALLEGASANWANTPSLPWVEAIEPELENVRDALHWSLTASSDIPLGVRIVIASRRLWAAVSPREGLRWIAEATERLTPELEGPVIAYLYLAEAHMRTSLQQHAAALAAAQRALSASPGLPYEMTVAEARGFAGLALAFTGKPAEAIDILEQALNTCQSVGSKHYVAHAFSDLGMAHSAAGDVLAARSAFREALRVFRVLEYARETTSVAGNLAELEYWSGDVEAAVRLCVEAVAGTADPRSFARYMANLAAYYVALSRWDEARAVARQVLFLRPRPPRAEIDIAYTIQHLAAIAALEPKAEGQMPLEAERAAQLLGFVDAWLERLENERQLTEQREYERVAGALDRIFSPAGFSALAEAGRSWSEKRALTEALHLASPPQNGVRDLSAASDKGRSA
jgi:predicted ATPase/class 3 adenylate cyclase